MRLILLLLIIDQSESRQYRKRSWSKKSVCSPRNCNSCDAFLSRYAGTKKTSLGSREFQFCSSMRRNRQCCGVLGNGIVDLIGVSSECCDQPSGCIRTVGQGQNDDIDETDVRNIMAEMEQCHDSSCGEILNTMNRCLSAQTTESKRPQYVLIISAFVLMGVLLIGFIVLYQQERNKVQKNHEANERKSLVEHPN